ncbi:hypothetical protein [Leucobacter sp. 1207-22]|uniref:hypothetical protein n=1 Tax=Leucobacter sp. 1207-22 TaxID=2604456 RepID=UPI004063639A
MAARLFRLRVALLGGLFRGTGGHVVSAVLRLVLGFAGAVLLALLPVLLIDDIVIRDTIDVLIGSLLLAGVLVVPFFDSRRMMDVRQFTVYPVKAGSLAWGMLLSGIATWPFFIFLAWLVTLLCTRPLWSVGPVWALPTAGVLIALFALVSARLAAGLSQLWVSSRIAGTVRLIGVVLLIALIPVLAFAFATVFRPEDEKLLEGAAHVLGWTPFGAGFTAGSMFGTGMSVDALTRLAVLLAATLLVGVLWFVVARATHTSLEAPIDVLSARRGLGWFERFSARPASVVAARQLTYWARDPRYRVALAAIPIAPIVMLLAFWVAGADLRLLAVIPLPVLMLLFGWSLHNDVAMDSTAIWEHVASGVDGRADRWGRLAPVLMFGVPIAVIGSSLTSTIIGDWRVLPALIGMNLGVLWVSSGVSSVFSALMPYPATRPGESPFAQPQWSGSGSGTAQTLSMVAAAVLSLVPVVVSGYAIAVPELGWNILALVVGVAFGLLILAVGVLLGGVVFNRRGPELIAATQMFD